MVEIKKFELTQTVELVDENGRCVDVWKAGTIVEGYLDCDILWVDTEDDTYLLHPGDYKEVIA